MPVTNIHESEWDDLDTEIERHKRSRGEFEFSERVFPMIGSGVQPLRGRITVRSSRTGMEREYDTGHGSSWVADFSRDLAAGAL